MNAPMNPNKALWEKGDFTRIAESMRESGEALVKGLGITKGLKVLDLVCRLLPEKKKEKRLASDQREVDNERTHGDAGHERASDACRHGCKLREEAGYQC